MNRFEPTFRSVRQHSLPGWYDDAKLGIFIHWGIFSVPAFAPSEKIDLPKMLNDPLGFGLTPYTEWYQNSLRISGSPVHQHHLATYGRDFPYENFAPVFNQLIKQWDPQAWADLIHNAGARYVVLVTKHHDGFLMWPSARPNPRRPGYYASRDVAGELTQAVTARGLKMGFYYSSLLDWSFSQQPICRFSDLMTSADTSPAYREYAATHWRELVDRYNPWVLWGDIGYPAGSNLPALFAYFYNRQPEGVVNDRWIQIPAFFHSRSGRRVLEWLMRGMVKTLLGSDKPRKAGVPHCDFTTTEYSHFKQAARFKWEACRGIGNGFGYNQFERGYLAAPELIRLLVEIVSANGNLLLNIGPRPDGSIPDEQVNALTGLGTWLTANGEAIYGTRPWRRISDTGKEGARVHYTCQGNTLYIHITTPPSGGSLSLPELPIATGSGIQLLENRRELTWTRQAGRLVVQLPESTARETIPVLKMELAS